MSRKPKFRVWDSEQNKIIIPRGITFYVDSVGYFFSLKEGCCSIHFEKEHEGRFVIQEFTGKKDKAAREIYEGDIVKLKTHLDFGDQFGQHIFLEVYYHEESASFRLSRDKQMGYYRNFTDLESGHIEVVGNIFENPELLQRGHVDLHVHSVYLDSDGSVHCYDMNGELVEYPSHWPEKIENVREFARREGVKLISG